ncbi:hypothetical protein BHM03_00036192, partial [Ensete ventricosum]
PLAPITFDSPVAPLLLPSSPASFPCCRILSLAPLLPTGSLTATPSSSPAEAIVPYSSFHTAAALFLWWTVPRRSPNTSSRRLLILFFDDRLTPPSTVCVCSQSGLKSEKSRKLLHLLLVVYPATAAFSHISTASCSGLSA